LTEQNITLQLTKDELIIVNEALLKLSESANSYYKEIAESILSRIEGEQID
jgi:hypothetical protein